MRIFLEERDGAHQHARRAEAALEPVLRDESLLDGMELAVRLEAFDRPDFSAVRLHREHGARLHRFPIQQDRAGAAVRRVTADVRPGQAEVLPEEMNE